MSVIPTIMNSRGITLIFIFSKKGHCLIKLKLITYCPHVLIKLEANSEKPLLRISPWLKATLWKPSYIWLRRFKKKSKT